MIDVAIESSASGNAKKLKYVVQVQLVVNTLAL